MRQWARRGTRPRQPADQRYESAYLFGAICPARGVGAALAMPYADTEAMQLHLDEIARTVAKGAHAVLLLDRAGWHTTRALAVPRNITMILLPSRAPELNPVENIWQYLRANWLEPSLRDLRGHHRGRLRRLAQAHRHARDNHLDRHTRVGDHRSKMRAGGISAGDIIRTPPGETHGVENTGEEALIYLAVTTPPQDFSAAYVRAQQSRDQQPGGLSS